MQPYDTTLFIKNREKNMTSVMIRQTAVVPFPLCLIKSFKYRKIRQLLSCWNARLQNIQKTKHTLRLYTCPFHVYPILNKDIAFFFSNPMYPHTSLTCNVKSWTAAFYPAVFSFAHALKFANLGSGSNPISLPIPAHISQGNTSHSPQCSRCFSSQQDFT